MRWTRSPRYVRCVGLALIGVLGWASVPVDATASSGPSPHEQVLAKPRVLVVPRDYPTIQTAVDAAHDGDDIVLRPGTYREQVFIQKDLTISGSGERATTIRAPRSLRAGRDGSGSIVEISDGANVGMSRLTVSGPGGGTCEDGALGAGIRVLGGAHLDLRFARVIHIKDTPVAPCFHSATAILVGNFPNGVASATIRRSQISDYQGSGIVILGPRSTATVSRNVVSGSHQVWTSGIEFLGATGKIKHNLVRANRCRRPNPDCGRDFFKEFQSAGIGAGGVGVVIAFNRLVSNQIGIYVSESAEIHDNVMVDNDYFGMALQDGSFVLHRDRILGGGGGVAVIAATADTSATLDDVRIRHTSGPRTRTFECCGFAATYGVGP